MYEAPSDAAPTKRHFRDATAPYHMWCPVIKTWCSMEQDPRPKITHVIPRGLDAHLTNYMLRFDQHINILDSRTNQIPLCAKVAAAFTAGDITFIPCSSDGSSNSNNTVLSAIPGGYQVFLVNKKMASAHAHTTISGPGRKPIIKHTTWGELHGTPLEFINGARPARRYVFFHAFWAWVRAQACAWPGREALGEEMFAPSAWGEEAEGLLREDAVREVVREVGCEGGLPGEVVRRMFGESAGADAGVRHTVEFRREMGERLLLAGLEAWDEHEEQEEQEVEEDEDDEGDEGDGDEDCEQLDAFPAV